MPVWQLQFCRNGAKALYVSRHKETVNCSRKLNQGNIEYIFGCLLLCLRNIVNGIVSSRGKTRFGPLEI